MSQGLDGPGDQDEPGERTDEHPAGLDLAAERGPDDDGEQPADGANGVQGGRGQYVDDGPPRTGDPAVDAALATAAAVRGAEPAEQLETYVGTHRSLQERLADSGA